MILIPFLALLLGLFLAYIFRVPIGSIPAQYLALGSIAGLDSICGGIRSGLEGKFNNGIFVSGFFSNVLIAFFLAWIGDRIFLDLYLAVLLVLGWRIFTNLSLIRRYLLTRWQDSRERKRLMESAKGQATQMQTDSTK